MENIRSIYTYIYILNYYKSFCWTLEKGMANHFSILALRTTWMVWKGKKIGHWKDERPRLVHPQYATGDQWGNNSRKNEQMEPKQKQYSVVDVTGDGSEVWCYKEQYSIGTWNVRSMNQGKFEVVKQKMARANTDILGINELKWTGMDEFIQMTIISTTVGKNPLEEME